MQSRIEPLFTHPLTDLSGLDLRAEKAEIVEYQGRRALRLESGLALLPFAAADLAIETWIAAEGPCYPGIVFRALDPANYELAYAQPHTNGAWDALQYDPVFNGSNTWQVYHGPAYQRTAEVPTGRWFSLRLEANGERAALTLDDQPALVVERLARGCAQGQIGIWTYLPAYFAGLRVFSGAAISAAGLPPCAPAGAILDWDLEGVGPIRAEANGALNLNRFLPVSAQTARLSQRITLPEALQVRFGLGFSDRLAFSVDGREVFQGENLFHGMENRYEVRGYVIPNQHPVELDLDAGEHLLEAHLSVSEYFGWGLAVTMQ